MNDKYEPKLVTCWADARRVGETRFFPFLVAPVTDSLSSSYSSCTILWAWPDFDTYMGIFFNSSYDGMLVLMSLPYSGLELFKARSVLMDFVRSVTDDSGSSRTSQR